MQTVLITGANGFVGYYLTQLLLKKGFRVIATGKGENRLYVEDKNFSYQTLDFTNDEEVEKIFLKQKNNSKKSGGIFTFVKPDLIYFSINRDILLL